VHQLRPGGVRAVVAESLSLKHQILISNRTRQRAPNLTAFDRFLIGLTTLFMNPRRIRKRAALLKPATFFKFHKILVDRKYHLLFSCSSHRRKPAPKGPSAELIAAILEMKHRNPRFGCVRIAQQINYASTSTKMSCAASSRSTTALLAATPWEYHISDEMGLMNRLGIAKYCEGKCL
jgi:putative transposase